MAGCSLVLDFSEKAIPADAAVYSADECAYKEPNDGVAEAMAIVATDIGPAAICSGAAEDHDFYRFTVPANTTKVEIRLTYTYRQTGDLDLKLIDPTNGTVLARSASFSDEELIVCPSAAAMCPTLAARDYVFEVHPGRAGAVNRYMFALAFTPM